MAGRRGAGGGAAGGRAGAGSRPAATRPRAAAPGARGAGDGSPVVAVLVVIFTVVEGELQALLIHRSGEPFRGRWAVPGGLLRAGESLQEAATRKLVEETGVEDVYLEQLYTFSHLDDVTPGGSLAVTYFALVDHDQARLAERREWQPAWFPVLELVDGATGQALAFRNEEVVSYALERLRNKMEYTNVAYSLLPRRFTLSQLQRVYESILGRKLDKRNFRKRMQSLGVIEATSERVAEGAGRPAQLYRFAKR